MSLSLAFLIFERELFSCWDDIHVMPLRSNDVGGHIPRLSNSFRILGILFTPDAKRSKASSSVASSGILLWHTQPSLVATAISVSRRDDDGEDFAGVFTNRFFGVGRMDSVSSLAAKKKRTRGRSIPRAGGSSTPPERLVRWGGVLGDTTSSCALGKEGEGGEAALPL